MVAVRPIVLLAITSSIQYLHFPFDMEGVRKNSKENKLQINTVLFFPTGGK